MASTANHATGPRTAAGIENCKYNATRHGLTGQHFVLKSENPADYDALRASLLNEYQPNNEEEAMLVERIAQCWWKLQRAERYERSLLNFGEEDDECPFATARFATFIRYRNSIERAWNRARAELAALKKASQAAARQLAKPQPAKAQPVRESVSHAGAPLSETSSENNSKTAPAVQNGG